MFWEASGDRSGARGLVPTPVDTLSRSAFVFGPNNLNWQWWRATAKNSLCRQLMFNSTSILADVRGDAIDQPGYAGSCLVIKSRALCTFRWFFSTHVNLWPCDATNRNQLWAWPVAPRRPYRCIIPSSFQANTVVATSDWDGGADGTFRPCGAGPKQSRSM
ncbi:hypothetical protein H310_12814 [Aphanomyces invadans]|uniref:Ricin B lectin domain-containing protein n=1 Tax=Aphanomyces invadans TaxID=157072 RepID=A0A024TIM5_9STRA|nr:hypothetical protein H310_12814 [Aphanomyces invadans]ETV93217.1 hypothetical protein H310_12814 [Aphanomyces invadans]|eukprot:XP_008878239.1 hypothetical protein H310_12814 [Aphanomyces invadans]